MDRNEKEEWIDKVLVFMNDYIEEKGHKIQNLTFDFSDGDNDEDFKLFAEKNKISFDEFSKILNICTSRNFLKISTIGGGKYSSLKLTEMGQSRAISSLKQDKTLSESGGTYIGTFNSNGVAQIGNNNTINIENMLLNLVEQIEQSNGTEEEKEEAKNRLSEFLKHPLVQTIFGAAIGAIL